MLNRSFNSVVSRESKQNGVYSPAQFVKQIEGIKSKHRIDIGQSDIKYVKSVRNRSRIFEVIGRLALWFGFDPFSFAIGVVFTFLHRNLEAVELGHNCLHGQYDSLGDIPEFHSHNFRWKAPIDEEGWRREHNGIHHVQTNVYGIDPDLNHGFLRTNARLPWNRWHYIQVPLYLFYFYPQIMYKFNAQNLGFNEDFRANQFPNGNEGYALYPYKMDTKDRTSAKSRNRISINRIVLKEYFIFPLLALITGYSWARVAVGNLIVDILNNYWMAFTLQSSHFTQELQEKQDTTKKASWYKAQIESSINFKASKIITLMCGHVNYQIEHHLFPDIPSHRYPEISFEVQAICEEHNIVYPVHSSWFMAIKKYLGVFVRYSFPPKKLQ